MDKVCATCGSPVTGRAKYCRLHRSVKNRSRDLKRLAEKDPKAAAEMAGMIKAAEQGVEVGPFAAELLACFLRHTDDPVKAAAKAKLNISDEEAHELAEVARSEHLGIIEGSQAELAKSLQTSMFVAAYRGLAQADKMGTAQLGNFIRSIAQTLEAVVGGVQPVYGEIKLVLPEGDK